MPTIKDVAEKAGLAVATVSRVLNNRGYISQATRDAVYNAMRELNYQPNELARSLVKKQTSLIGVIVPSVMHPFFSKVVYYLETYASSFGYKIMLCNSRQQADKEMEYIDMLKSNKVSGIVICSHTPDIEKNLEINLPVVTFERSVSKDIPAVMSDNYQGGVLATKHLIECGCKHLVHLSGNSGMKLPADSRSSAFLNVCKENEVEGKIFSTTEEEFNSMDYLNSLMKVIDENPGTDGIFCSSDVIAAEVIQVCKKKQIDIPDQIKVVGFDDTDVATLVSPAITTIGQPIELLCRYAVENIIKKINNEIVPSQTVLPVSLIRRETT